MQDSEKEGQEGNSTFTLTYLGTYICIEVRGGLSRKPWGEGASKLPVSDGDRGGKRSSEQGGLGGRALQKTF